MGIIFTNIAYGFKWLQVISSNTFFQVGQLFTWPGSFCAWFDHQKEIFNLLWLDKNHRLDVWMKGRQNLDGALAHVDTMSNNMGNTETMDVDIPPVKELVLIGGGHSHAFTLKNFGMQPMPGVRVTLVSRDTLTPYSGMMPGYVAGYYTKRECHIDLVKLARYGNARFIHAECVGIDHNEKVIFLKGPDGKDRPPIPYDVLSINIGITPKLMTSEEELDAKNIIPVKPISEFADRWTILLNKILRSERQMRICVVGAGAAGVELACSMYERVRKDAIERGKDPDRVRFAIFSRRKYILPSHNRRVREIFMDILQKKGIEVILNAEIVDCSKSGHLITADGDSHKYSYCILCTKAKGQDWLQSCGLETKDTFVAVEDTLESVNCPGIFAAGDIAAVIKHPRDKAGVFAVRQGPPLTMNLRRKLKGERLMPFHPQVKFLGLIGTGNDSLCVASKGDMALAADWLWDLKDWIDRKWMAQYSSMLTLMEMDDPKVPKWINGKDTLTMLAAKPMRCGGCGGKVGSNTLSRALNRLKQENLMTPENEYVVVGLEQADDAAILKATDCGTVHTIDFLKEIVEDPYIFGQITACHSLSDLDAMGAKSIAAMAIVMIPYGLDAHVSETLYQMLAGACYVFNLYGVSLIGGHTCEGDEMALGFSVHGVLENGDALPKGGMKPGEVLVLTKPIGTGTIMAAEMRLKAFGEWVESAVESMKTPNLYAGECLRKHDASSCTDVTGFGVVGHLLEMCKASQVEVELYVDQVPLLNGAMECVQQNIFSSLQPDNLRLRRGVTVSSKHDAFPLLFDPQTSGGLLASIPVEKAESCLSSLHKLGYPSACIIGRVTGKKTEIPFINVNTQNQD